VRCGTTTTGCDSVRLGRDADRQHRADRPLVPARDRRASGRPAGARGDPPTIGLSLIDELERIAPGKGQDLLLTYRGFLRAHHDALIAEYEGVAALLAGLAEREVPMGIVTAKALVTATPSLQRFRLDRLMRTIVTWDDTERHKPHPDPLLLAAARLGVSPETCWYVGDSTHDMAAARAADMRAIAAAWGPYPRAELAALAGVVLDAPGDLLALLDRAAG
jgi:pyrophosphatase PpaX